MLKLEENTSICKYFQVLVLVLGKYFQSPNTLELFPGTITLKIFECTLEIQKYVQIRDFGLLYRHF